MSPMLLPAKFQPQAWVGDNAVDVDGAFEFDAAEAFYDLSPAKMAFVAKEIFAGRHDIDELIAGNHDALGHAQGGPFTVSVEPGDLFRFLAAHGIFVIDEKNPDEATLKDLPHLPIKAVEWSEDDMRRIFSDVESPWFPMSDWRYEVSNGDTSAGYHTFLASKYEMETYDIESRMPYDFVVAQREQKAGLDRKVAEIESQFASGDYDQAIKGYRELAGIAAERGSAMSSEAFQKAGAILSLPVDLGHDDPVDALVVNDLDQDEPIWLIQVATGAYTHFFLVSAHNEQDALDEYADNAGASSVTRVDSEADDEDFAYLGNAGEPHLLDNASIDRVERPAPDQPFVIQTAPAPAPR